MKCLYPFKDDPSKIRELGRAALLQLERAAEQTDALPCPFCGGEAKAGLMSNYGNPAVYIQCACCRIKTVNHTAGSGVMSFDITTRTWKPSQTTLIDALNQAAAEWNRRAG